MNNPLLHHLSMALATAASAANNNNNINQNNRASLDSTTATVASAEDDSFPYYEDEDWVPLQSNGKQRSPNMIRNELQRYMDKTPGLTAAAMQRTLSVSANSYGKFMNPKTYKDPWSAIQNGTYWAAARFLEQERLKPKKKAATVSSKKRAAEGAVAAPGGGGATKKLKADQVAFMERIHAYEAPSVSADRVYESCPDVIKMCKAFLSQDGVTKTDFMRTALGGIHANSLNPFLASKKQDKAGSIAYARAWVFFEKKRLLEGQPKSKARVKHETENPDGFALSAPSQMGLYFYGVPGEVFTGW